MKIKIGTTSFGVMNDYLAHRRHLPVVGHRPESEISVKREKKQPKNTKAEKNTEKKAGHVSTHKGLDIVV